ncbi:MAG: hypothetical protein V3T17_04860 [Pseudomonadales bacterium]
MKTIVGEKVASSWAVLRQKNKSVPVFRQKNKSVPVFRFSLICTLVSKNKGIYGSESGI